MNDLGTLAKLNREFEDRTIKKNRVVLDILDAAEKILNTAPCPSTEDFASSLHELAKAMGAVERIFRPGKSFERSGNR